MRRSNLGVWIAGGAATALVTAILLTMSITLLVRTIASGRVGTPDPGNSSSGRKVQGGEREDSSAVVTPAKRSPQLAPTQAYWSSLCASVKACREAPQTSQAASERFKKSANEIRHLRLARVDKDARALGSRLVANFEKMGEIAEGFTSDGAWAAGWRRAGRAFEKGFRGDEAGVSQEIIEGVNESHTLEGEIERVWRESHDAIWGAAQTLTDRYGVDFVFDYDTPGS